MLSNLSVREKKMLYFLLLFLLVLVFVQFFIKLLVPSYREAKLTLEEKKQELAEAHILVQELECLTKEKNELTIEQKYLLKKFQISFDAGYPFDYLGKGDLDLYINNITPYPINKTDYYSNLQIDMKITGTYLSVLRYLEKIENLPAITEVVSPIMTINEDNLVVCDFTLNIYSVDTHWNPEKDVSQILGKYDIFTPLVQALGSSETSLETEHQLDISTVIEEEVLVASSESLQEEKKAKEDEIYYHFPSR